MSFSSRFQKLLIQYKRGAQEANKALDQEVNKRPYIW